MIPCHLRQPANERIDLLQYVSFVRQEPVVIRVGNPYHPCRRYAALERLHLRSNELHVTCLLRCARGSVTAGLEIVRECEDRKNRNRDIRELLHARVNRLIDRPCRTRSPGRDNCRRRILKRLFAAPAGLFQTPAGSSPVSSCINGAGPLICSTAPASSRSDNSIA